MFWKVSFVKRGVAVSGKGRLTVIYWRAPAQSIWLHVVITLTKGDHCTKVTLYISSVSQWPSHLAADDKRAHIYLARGNVERASRDQRVHSVAVQLPLAPQIAPPPENGSPLIPASSTDKREPCQRDQTRVVMTFGTICVGSSELL
jgi:hypothetical protein